MKYDIVYVPTNEKNVHKLDPLSKVEQWDSGVACYRNKGYFSPLKDVFVFTKQELNELRKQMEEKYGKGASNLIYEFLKK